MPYEVRPLPGSDSVRTEDTSANDDSPDRLGTLIAEYADLATVIDAWPPFREEIGSVGSKPDISASTSVDGLRPEWLQKHLRS